MRVLRAARGTNSWIRVFFHGAPGNWCQTTTKIQQHIINSDNKMTSRFRAPGNMCGVVRVQDQGAPGNWCEVMTIWFKGQLWHSTTMQISDDRYLENVFKNLRQKLNLAEEAPVLDLKINLVIICVDNDESLLSSWTTLQWKVGSIQEL